MDILVAAAITLLIVVVIVGIVLSISYFNMTKTVTHEFKGHTIMVKTSIFKASFYIDDKLIDDVVRVGGSNYSFDFIKKIDDDTVRVTIHLSVMSPEIKIYINDERVK